MNKYSWKVQHEKNNILMIIIKYIIVTLIYQYLYNIYYIFYTLYMKGFEEMNYRKKCVHFKNISHFIFINNSLFLYSSLLICKYLKINNNR